jgi:hypothetical protein
LQQIIDILKAQTSAEIILVTSVFMANNEEMDFVEPFYVAMISLAEFNQIPVARFHRLMQEKITLGLSFESLVLDDMVQPYEKGYNLMAETIMQLF